MKQRLHTYRFSGLSESDVEEYESMVYEVGDRAFFFVPDVSHPDVTIHGTVHRAEVEDNGKDYTFVLSILENAPQ